MKLCVGMIPKTRGRATPATHYAKTQRKAGRTVSAKTARGYGTWNAFAQGSLGSGKRSDNSGQGSGSKHYWTIGRLWRGVRVFSFMHLQATC